MKNDWSAVIFILVVVIFAIIVLSLSCVDYDNYYVETLNIPPALYSECNNVGEKRRFEYGDYDICIECIFDENSQYDYYKYWIEISCEDF